jgi:D-glycero-D-manno-heptose 1,7-bisphosphate phosphatase
MKKPAVLKAVFLDRDGVINKKREGDYVRRWEEFEFLPFAHEALQKLSQAGLAVIVITNQRGIARGLYTHEDLLRMHERMRRCLRPATIQGIYYCPHDKDEECGCRKPKPGMIRKALRDFGLSPPECALIGDSEGDMEAARAAKLGTTILVGTRKSAYAGAVRPDFFCRDLLCAARLLLAKARKAAGGTKSRGRRK